MSFYQAIKTDDQPVDLGEFDSLESARSYAMTVYSGEVKDVIETPQIELTTEAMDPAWLVLGLAGLLLLFSAKKKKKRGRNVR